MLLFKMVKFNWSMELLKSTLPKTNSKCTPLKNRPPQMPQKEKNPTSSNHQPSIFRGFKVSFRECSNLIGLPGLPPISWTKKPYLGGNPTTQVKTYVKHDQMKISSTKYYPSPPVISCSGEFGLLGLGWHFWCPVTTPPQLLSVWKPKCWWILS